VAADVEGAGSISFAEMRRVLAFMALSLSTQEREQALRDADFDRKHSEGALDRFEFMDLCVNLLWDTDLGQLEAAAASYSEYRAALKRRNNARMRRYADAIDRQARVWVPLTYLMTFAALMSIQLEDRYNELTQEYIALGGNASAVDAANKLQRLESTLGKPGVVSKFYAMADGLTNIYVVGVSPTPLPVFVAAAVLLAAWIGAQLWSDRRAKRARALEHSSGQPVAEKTFQQAQLKRIQSSPHGLRPPAGSVAQGRAPTANPAKTQGGAHHMTVRIQSPSRAPVHPTSPPQRPPVSEPAQIGAQATPSMADAQAVMLDVPGSDGYAANVSTRASGP
jgi:hypothetical protein